MKQLLSVILSILFAGAVFLGIASCTHAHPDAKKERSDRQSCIPPEAAAEEDAGKTGPTDQVNTPVKQIWLTFDDGPTDSTTPKILDILKRENVKATFFVIGRQITKREKILRREADEGHTIGIHTYTHEYKKIYASADALLKDITLCKEAIRSVLPDFKTDLYRFPGGSFNVNKKLIAAVGNAGYRHFDWNASAEDAVDPNTPASVLYQNVLASARDKNNVILLMHDGVGYRETIQCLPDVIDYFRECGYIFSTL